MKNIKFACCSLVVWFSLLATNSAQAQFQDAAKWVPESANTIVMVQAKKILSSPLAVKNKWKSERSKAFRSGVSFFPASTRRLLIASQIDFQYMEEMWCVSVFENAANDIEIVEVSKRIHGNIESIGDKSAVVLPNDAYLVQIDNSTLVSMSPANRQMTSRWIETSMRGSANLSPYLTDAVKFADDNADVIVAFDLNGVMNKTEVAKRLKEFGSIDEKLIDQFSNTMASIQGLTLGVTIRDKITGAIKIDFKESPVGMLNESKAILIYALKKNGLMIDDLESWTMTADGNQLVMSGGMSSEGLRQIGTLIRQPLHDDFVSSDSSSSDSTQPEVNMATRSLQYFGDIQHITESLRKKDLNNLRTYTRWFDRYSREIDGLSVLGVDESLLQYGGYVANSFRDIANSLRGSDLDRTKGVASQGTFNRSGGYDDYGRFGYYDSRSVNRRNKIIASNLGTQAGKNAAMQIMEEVNSETAKMRQAMSKKYELDF